MTLIGGRGGANAGAAARREKRLAGGATIKGRGAGGTGSMPEVPDIDK